MSTPIRYNHQIGEFLQDGSVIAGDAVSGTLVAIEHTVMTAGGAGFSASIDLVLHKPDGSMLQVEIPCSQTVTVQVLTRIEDAGTPRNFLEGVSDKLLVTDDGTIWVRGRHLAIFEPYLQSLKVLAQLMAADLDEPIVFSSQDEELCVHQNGERLRCLYTPEGGSLPEGVLQTNVHGKGLMAICLLDIRPGSRPSVYAALPLRNSDEALQMIVDQVDTLRARLDGDHEKQVEPIRISSAPH